jgi:hypothetical protein
MPVANWSVTSGGNAVGDFTDLSSNATSWLWEFGDPLNSTSVDQNPMFVYGQSGQYTVCLYATNSCGTDTFCQVADIYFFSIEEDKLSKAVSLYPNPANEILHVEFDFEQQMDVEMQIRDLSGKLIETQNLGVVGKGITQISIENLAQGSYYVRFITPLGEVVKQLVRVN